MMLSVRLPILSPVKQEVEEEVRPEEPKIPELKLEDFDSCAACKVPFRGKKKDGNGEEEEPRRGQQPSDETVGEGRKVKAFYSFNTITGELLHVTALQAVLSVFELRLLKNSPGVDIHGANENIGFCQNCGTLVSQLYKLHQEVSGLLKEGSILQRLLDYEDLLTDNHETDFSAPKRKKPFRNPSKVNGISLMEDMEAGAGGGGDEGESSNNNDWQPHPSNTNPSISWNNNDEDMGVDMNDDSMNYENDSQDNDDDEGGSEEVNIKPNISNRKTVGIKITSVGSAESIFSADEYSSESEGTSSGHRSRRSTAKKVDYAKVLEGPKIDGLGDDDPSDDEWKEKERKPHKSKSPAKAQKETARKKTTPSPSNSERRRGRPPKAAKVVVPPPKRKESDGAFKLPAEKTSKEASCQICKKVFPSSYLAEHMNVAHNAVQGQPCLICGKFFESSYKAIKHLLTHVPERAFGCSRCHSTFKTAEERNLHTTSHPDFDKKLQCPKCNQGFTSLLLLNKHEAQKHRTTKSFLCSICAKLLTGKDEWIQHILSHGPFQCYYCREFLRPGEYKRHVQTVHMGNRPRPSSSSAAASSSSGVIAEVTLD